MAAAADEAGLTATLAAPFAALGIVTDGRAVTRVAYLPKSTRAVAPRDRAAERAVRSSARAVGGACGANPIAVIVPCHRVVGSHGALGGFMHGEGAEAIAVKRWLLAHEGYRFGRC